MFKDFQVKTIRRQRRLQIYLKRDSGTGVFRWILRTLRTPFYIERLRWMLLIIQFLPLNQSNNR